MGMLRGCPLKIVLFSSPSRGIRDNSVASTTDLVLLSPVLWINVDETSEMAKFIFVAMVYNMQFYTMWYTNEYYKDS